MCSQKREHYFEFSNVFSDTYKIGFESIGFQKLPQKSNCQRDFSFPISILLFYI